MWPIPAWRHSEYKHPILFTQRRIVLALTVLVVALVACSPETPTQPTPQVRRTPKPDSNERSEDRTPPPDLSAYTDDDVPTASAADLQRRGDAANDLRWAPVQPALAGLLPGALPERSSVLAEKQRAVAAHDPAAQARANAVLAAEASIRASLVVRRWLDARDQATGLMVSRRAEEGTIGWFYQDTGSDLFPHIAIGTRLLYPDRYPEILAALAAERRLAPGVPDPLDDLLLPEGRRAGRPEGTRLFGTAEFAKDGLLPLIERLGPDPWLGRLREVADVLLVAGSTPTPRGPIPAATNEVNGDVLQALTRVYWATGDERYFLLADRIGRAYVEDMLPNTGWLPVHEWEFQEGEPIGRRRLRLSDHGNEIVAGLVGWHMMESLRGEPMAAAHRATIRKMLDRLLDKGRNPDGLWYRVMEIPSGRVDQRGLSDNWGYLVQAFLAQGTLERVVPDGDVARAERYEEAARAALRALPKYAYYPWQRGEMDGYADSLESALYLLPLFPDVAASRWVDEQMAVLFGFQHADGTVEDTYLDGNFVRTTLLYGLALTGGTWPEPWQPGVAVGAALSGGCLDVAIASASPWNGLLRFDTPRYREHLNLPLDFPRLNEWPEGFVAEAGQVYDVRENGGRSRQVPGSALAAGLPLIVEPGIVHTLHVCPTG